MKIVIEIPKKVYNALTHIDFDASLVVNEMRSSIANGTLLPKGHGRLIDADAVLEDPIGNTYRDIDIAEAIIEADKEGDGE